MHLKDSSKNAYEPIQMSRDNFYLSFLEECKSGNVENVQHMLTILALSVEERLGSDSQNYSSSPSSSNNREDSLMLPSLWIYRFIHQIDDCDLVGITLIFL